jgi:hypothetical protein
MRPAVDRLLARYEAGHAVETGVEETTLAPAADEAAGEAAGDAAGGEE